MKGNELENEDVGEFVDFFFNMNKNK